MRARLTPILAFAFAVAVGWAAVRGYLRGGQDFRVFHHAAGLALQGDWDLLYIDGPDRYLYAPGFALLLAPLAALPFPVAHAIWLVATLAALAATSRFLALRFGTLPTILAGVFSLRALAIDLRYGQVNVIILAAATWALAEWFRRKEAGRDFKRLAAWFVFAIAAVAKLYPLALFLFPAFAGLRGDRADRRESLRVAGAALAATVVLMGLPYLFHAYPFGGLEAEWFAALGRKGLPTNTDNQSFAAFLARWMAGEPFQAMKLGGATIEVGGVRALGLGTWVSSATVAFALVAAGAFVRIAWRNARAVGVRGGEAAALGIALCFVPAHLVWKSYFLLGFPLLAFVFSALRATEPSGARTRTIAAFVCFGVFLAVTPSLPPTTAAWIEATSPFLWAHLFAAFTGVRMLSRPASPSA